MVLLSNKMAEIKKMHKKMNVRNRYILYYKNSKINIQMASLASESPRSSVLSDSIQHFSKLVSDNVPVMVRHSSGNFDILNSAWEKFIYEHSNIEMQRVNYYLTDLGKRIMRELNPRGQPLVYVAFRFVKSRQLHAAIFNTDRTLMELRTWDGSTPLIGWAWQNGKNGCNAGNRSMISTDDEVMTMRRMIYPKELWEMMNMRGETAESFL